MDVKKTNHFKQIVSRALRCLVTGLFVFLYSLSSLAQAHLIAQVLPPDDLLQLRYPIEDGVTNEATSSELIFNEIQTPEAATPEIGASDAVTAEVKLKSKRNKHTSRKPASYAEKPCFETSKDRYRVKRTNNLSTILYNLKILPLWCDTCSVPVGAKINNISNRDLIFPNQIIVLPRKCQYDQLAERRPQSIDPYGVSSESVGSLSKVISFRRFGVEPFINFSEMKGSNDTSDVKLISTLGTGLKIYYQSFFDTKFEWTSYLSLYKTSPQDNPVIGEVVDASMLPISIGGAIIYNYNSDWQFNGGAALKEEIYFETITPTQALLTKAWNKELTGGLAYKFFEDKKVNVRGVVDTAILLPTSVPSGTTQLGTLYDLGFRATYKMNWGRLIGGISYGNRDQKTNTVKYSENFVFYRAGFYYLF